MRITEQSWTDYIDRLARLNAKAGELMGRYIEQHGLGDHDALIRYAYALVQKYGEGSAALACLMYDAIAQAEKAAVQAAEPADAPSYGEVAKMVNGTIESPANLQSGVGRLVKRAAADTTLKNAVRDGAEFAWVPHGDTCPFCITLASRGWQKASKKALEGGHAEHIHANCDCEYAIRFNSSTTVAGYDPDKYLRQYENAGGDINAMRRERYATNKDAINAQKRAAYAARKENGSSEKDIGFTSAPIHDTITLSKQPHMKPNSQGKNVFRMGFSEKNLQKHFEKYGREYPNITKEEYDAIALELIQSETSDDILGYKTSNGAIVRYRISTNDFVKGYPNTAIATMFKPKGSSEAGYAYYLRQLKIEGILDD